ncbi:DUF2306 domain-containing protein [uncultured Kordia sp.]|uniref:DUF2306 domain-containing protein n=1 Tax=uncultured Kordia sp. TaxID=507699 RepID=UPI0026104607|nr:DUF2306 domain-containing protein [uncultured Kordia sp.]
MEIFATYLIYIHATLGSIAFIAGFIAIITKKGDNYHKKSGIVFYYAMLLAAISALIIAVLPKHENPFLFTIGLFSAYFIITGYRALRFKKPNPLLIFDKVISGCMLLTGIIMIAYPIIFTGKINILLTIFGSVGIIFSIRDLLLFKNIKKLRKSWLKLHIGKMLGGYIAAVTAFIVVNQFIPGIAGWLTPSIFGAAYITYWFKKLKKKPLKIPR